MPDCLFIFINSSTPNRRSLGTPNGLAQTTASLARAVGPAMATSLFAFSIEHDLAGGYAVYVVFVALTAGAVAVATRLPVKPWTKDI